MTKITNTLLTFGEVLDFHSACALHDEQAVRTMLLTNPAYAHLPGPDGACGLAWAARRGQHAIISLLL